MLRRVTALDVREGHACLSHGGCEARALFWASLLVYNDSYRYWHAVLVESFKLCHTMHTYSLEAARSALNECFMTICRKMLQTNDSVHEY
jgi:hypothetical protein